MLKNVKDYVENGVQHVYHLSASQLTKPGYVKGLTVIIQLQYSAGKP